MQIQKNVLTVILLLLIAYAGFLGYFIITGKTEIDFQINWNMFKSVLLWPLAILGFFVGLGMKFPQYVPFIKTTHSDGKVEYERNYDVVENMFASIVMPLLQFFVLGPLLIAAMIYYPLMVLIYFFGKIFPYLILVFFIMTIVLFYQWENIHVKKNGKSFSMLLISLLLIGVLWLLTVLWVYSDESQSLKIINIVSVVFAVITIVSFSAIEIWIHKKQKSTMTFATNSGTVEPAKISGKFIVAYIVSFLLVLFIYGFKSFSDVDSNKSNSGTSQSIALQPNYYCNASSVNVRVVAVKGATVIGKLTKGQEVYVYDLNHNSDFAKIDYNGKIGYISSEYLTPKVTSPVAANTDTNSTKPVKVANAAGMTGWSTFLLQGQVEKVIYDDGRYIYFNADGNVVKHNVRDRVRGQTEFEYVYSSPTRFTLKGDAKTPYKIVCDSNTRQEIWDDSEGLGLTFKYDAKGRLITVSEPEYGMGRTETYTYEAGNSYPSKEEIEYYSDDGGGTKESFVFSNYAFDNQGNWIRRTVKYEKVVENENGKAETTTKEYSENRSISYSKI